MGMRPSSANGGILQPCRNDILVVAMLPPITSMNSVGIVCIAGGLEGLRPSKKNPRMHALLQEII
jgi:hypothetical protein